MVTSEQLKRYLENGGTACLFCGSLNIEGREFEAVAGGANQAVHCNNCGGDWYDIHTLTGIETDE